jgi:hypothetical protein
VLTGAIFIVIIISFGTTLQYPFLSAVDAFLPYFLINASESPH